MIPSKHTALIAAMGLLLAAFSVDVGRLVLAPTREASIDAVRIRNAMVAEVGDPGQTDWTPSRTPENYNLEKLPAPVFFTTIVDQLIPPEAHGEPALAKALRIAEHLRLTSRHGDPIQANTRETYEKIVGGQGGYCSDYTQAFNALALAAGLKVREWGFTWQDMANGHAFNEVWDPDLEKWVFIDAFTSFYVVDAATGKPMSALELRASLLDEPDAGQVKVIPIAAERFGFKSPEKALDWYRRGVPQMFLVMGNSVFSYDADPVIRMTEPLPRSVEMSVAVVFGEHPQFLFVPPASHPEIKGKVNRLRWQLLWTLLEIAAIPVLGVALLISIRQVKRAIFDARR